jgi:pimeloyl-ACP methyl ester carboxylesterase
MFSLAWPIVALVASGPQAAPGKLVEGVPCPSDPAQTYSIYLPSSYTPAKRWPLLIVFDPGGRGPRAAEVFRAAAERYGWIVAASETSRNGPWEPTLRAVNAMWPALLGGYAVDDKRVYTAGHSGGATVAWMIARQTGKVAGVIASGQPYPGVEEGKDIGFAWFGTAGHADFNFIEVKGIDARLARSRAPHRVEFFDGGHQWLPAELTIRALGWLELLAMKDGRRPHDGALAADTLAGDMALARAAEENGRLTEAWRSYDALIASYSGLLNVGEAESRRKTIESDARYKTMRKVEERADSRERTETNTVARMFTTLPVEELPPLQELRRQLHLDSLAKAARGDSYDAASARRSLTLIRVQLSSLIRELQEKGDARVAILQRIVDSMQ